MNNNNNIFRAISDNIGLYYEQKDIIIDQEIRK